MLKKIILFVALPLPVLVFLFLKFFGKNEFDVPIYWQEGVDRNIPGCNAFQVPHVVNDSLLTALEWKGSKATLIVVNNAGIQNNLVRIADLFQPGDYETLTIPAASYDVATCMLLAGDTARVVMIDDQKRIRGYYKPLTQKETDRLAVELRILLKQY